jgi:hypothetical protein
VGVEPSLAVDLPSGAAPGPGATASGYSIVLPPGWRKIPVRSGAEQAIRAAVKEAFAVLPRDAPPDRVGPHRVELERRLMKMAREARGHGGIDLCLPVVPVYGAPLAASFIVSELFGGPSAAPAGVVARLTAEDDTTHRVSIDGAEGVRAERTGGPIPGQGVDSGSRRVDYVLAVPGHPDRWLAVAFSTLGAGSPDDQVAVLLTSLFDAMMSTFRWGWATR